MDGQAVGLQVVVAGELQVVVQGLAVDRKLLCAGLGDGVDAFLGRGVDEVDAGLGAFGQPRHLAEGYVLGDVVVGQVQVGAVVAALPLQLVLHVGYDVVFLGVDGHDAAVLADFLEDFPQVARGDAGVEGGENLEAGDAGLDGLANLAQGDGRDGPGQDVVEGVVDEGMAAENIAAHFDLACYRVRGRFGAGRQRQGAGEVHVGGDAPEGGGAAGGFGRLGVDAGVAAGPVVRHRHVDVGVGLDAAGQHNHAGGVYRLPGADVVQRAGGGDRRNLLSLNANVHQSCPCGRNHGSAFDDQVQHDCLLTQGYEQILLPVSLLTASPDFRVG